MLIVCVVLKCNKITYDKNSRSVYFFMVLHMIKSEQKII